MSSAQQARHDEQIAITREETSAYEADNKFGEINHEYFTP